MVTRKEKIAILNAAPGYSASALLDHIEAQGFTIYRKKIIKERRPNSSQPMSDKLRAKIRADFIADPSLTQSALAARYNVNSGRVAEAIGDL